MFNVIEKNSSAQIVVKKSKFISNALYVESEDDAKGYIKDIEKKYYDSNHNCYAYSIYSKKGIINRCSDNGEPQGTAGSPMLKTINSKGLVNILIVVTRYFGGTLLGTGGLVKAYLNACNIVLENAKIKPMDIGLEMEIEVPYPEYQKLNATFKKCNIKTISTDFSENVKVIFDIKKDSFKSILSSLNINKYRIIKEKLIDA